MLFVIWAIAATAYFALLIGGWVVKRYRVELYAVALPVALLCAVLQFLDGRMWTSGLWVLAAVLEAVSLWSALKVRELSR